MMPGEIMAQDLPSQSAKFLKLEITVTGATPETDLDTPLWAFNRTRLRSKFLYNLYTTCVLGPVGRVHARPHFLGLVCEVLESDPQLDRDELLLTMYPSARSFLDLLTGLWFETLNLTLGSISATDRQLGFAERIDDGPAPPIHFRKYRGGAAYLGHFYRANGQPLPELRQGIEEAAEAVGAAVYFMGIRKAGVTLGENDVPSPADGGLLFSAADDDALKKLIEEPAYRELRGRTDGDSIALYQRQR